MLVLSRRPNQTIVIDNNEITVTVLGIQGSQVKLGINAPAHINIHKNEIHEKIKREEIPITAKPKIYKRILRFGINKNKTTNQTCEFISGLNNSFFKAI